MKDPVTQCCPPGISARRWSALSISVFLECFDILGHLPGICYFRGHDCTNLMVRILADLRSRMKIFHEGPEKPADIFTGEGIVGIPLSCGEDLNRRG